MWDTSIEMFEIVNQEAADKAWDRISIGDVITATFNGKRVSYKVLEKPEDRQPYSLYCQSPTNKVCMGIACTDIYQEELAMRIAADPNAAPRGRGRPPGSSNKPKQVEQQAVPQAQQKSPFPAAQPQAEPSQSFTLYPRPADPSQPFSDGSMWQEVPGTGGMGRLVLPPEAQDAYLMGTTHRAPIEQAEGNANWLQDSIDTAFADFKDAMTEIIEAIQDSGDAQEPEKVERFTCADCMFVDIDAGTCTKFNCIPPIFVVVNPAEKCSEFDRIPF